MSTLAKVIDKLIKKGQTEGLAEKIDVFYATGRLTEEEYIYLMKELDPDFNPNPDSNEG